MKHSKSWLRKHRGEIFKKRKVVLTPAKRLAFALKEIKRVFSDGYDHIGDLTVDIYDPYTSVIITTSVRSKMLQITGYTKRMPDDIPDDKMGIRVAVGRLAKRYELLKKSG